MTTSATPDSPIVLFDGVCNFCEKSVRFIIDRDAAGRFRFASLQSPIGAEIMGRYGIDPERVESVVLWEGERVHLRSGAALRIARRLRFPWNLTALFLVVPRFLRDPVYDLVARNRYRWFGRKDECMIPTPEIRQRFIDESSTISTQQ